MVAVLYHKAMLLVHIYLPYFPKRRVLDTGVLMKSSSDISKTFRRTAFEKNIYDKTGHEVTWNYFQVSNLAAILRKINNKFENTA